MANEPVKVCNIQVDLRGIFKNTKNFSELRQVQQTATCGLITFGEFGGDRQPIPPTNLGFTTVTFGTGWLTLVDVGAGGTGDFINEPSPFTAAFYLEGYSYNDIFFSNPVSSTSLYYAAYFGITIEAYDINDNLIASISGPANFVFSYSKWDPLTIYLGTNVISRIRIIAPGDYFLIDNLQVCLAPARGICFIP